MNGLRHTGQNLGLALFLRRQRTQSGGSALHSNNLSAMHGRRSAASQPQEFQVIDYGGKVACYLNLSQANNGLGCPTVKSHCEPGICSILRSEYSHLRPRSPSALACFSPIDVTP